MKLKFEKLLRVVFMGVTFYAGAVAAAPVSHVMTFSHGENRGLGGNSPGPINAAIFPNQGQYYYEDGIQFSAIGWVQDFISGTKTPKAPGQSIPASAADVYFGTSHVHGSTKGGNDFVFLEADAGGGFFKMLDGSAFALKGFDVPEMNLFLDNGKHTDIVLRGYTSQDFSSWVDVVVGSDTTGTQPVSPDNLFTTVTGPGFHGTHLNLDEVRQLQDVYLVEYWFDIFGRGNDPADHPDKAFANNLTFGIDNVHLSEPSSVPVPAAVWLFGSGFLGLFGIGRSRRPMVRA